MKRRAIGIAVLVITLVAVDVAARGGRGGGRVAAGGGRGFSRGGVAAGGSFGGRRAGAGAGGYDRQGPAASGRFAGRSDWRNQSSDAGNWQDLREQHQENVERRQERRQETREDWQDYAHDHAGERYYYPGTGYYYYEDYPYGGDVVGGDAVEIVDVPPNWTLDCVPNTVVVGATTYYQCGTAWYIRVLRGGEVAYTMVNPPAGY
jgi:hypothetical protein